eukprot:SAG31_NODE_3848_length_3818_cov_14.439634_4_plen_115_part_00
MWHFVALAEYENMSEGADCSAQVRVTSYVRHGNATLLAVASWATTNRTVPMHVDMSMLGIGTSGARAVAPAMRGVQPQAMFPIADGKLVMPVEAAGGWLVIIRADTNVVDDTSF